MKPRLGKVASATVILMAAFVVSRLLGLVRDMILGSIFGTGPELDAYFAAFRLPDLIYQIIVGAVLGSAFIPVFSRYMAKGEDEDGWYVASACLNLLTLACVFFASISFVFAPWLVPLITPGLAPEHQALAVELTRIMLISAVFFGMGGICMSILNARQHFLATAMAPVLYNLGIIGGAVFLSDSLGVRGLAVGVAAGSALFLAVQIPALVRLGMRYRFVARLGHAGVREIMKLMIPRTIGVGATQLNFVVAVLLASTLKEGSISALNYAWLITMMPISFFGVAISAAAFPTLAELAALDRFDELKRALLGSLRIVLFLSIPSSVGLFMLREPLVSLLFERGKFTAASVDATSFALAFYAAGLFAFGVVEVMTRTFYSLHDTRTPAGVAAAVMLLNIILSLVLVRFLQHGGLALSMSAITVVEAIALFALLHRRLGDFWRRELPSSIMKIVLASVAMAIVVAIFEGMAPALPVPFNGRLSEVAGGVAIGTLVFVGVSFVLRSAEIRLILRQAGFQRG
ncbi:MAG: murein biosynthesis integral membrane protein MurJ [Dehalococcoidia bacterium]|nr:murein biosynthesis integral membrane protein MurJ [Dehalococcoidia bacterium]